MAQGVQTFSSTGQLQFDSSVRLGRILYAGPVSSSGIAQETWTQVVSPTYAGELWGYIIPLMDLSGLDTNELYWPGHAVSIDRVGKPGQLFYSCRWYHPNTTTAGAAGTTTYDAYNNGILVYGVY